MINCSTGQVTIATGEAGGGGRCYALSVALRRARSVINDLVAVSMTLTASSALRLCAQHRLSALTDDQSISA
jgi:hypothetical protein